MFNLFGMKVREIVCWKIGCRVIVFFGSVRLIVKVLVFLLIWMLFMSGLSWFGCWCLLFEMIKVGDF